MKDVKQKMRIERDTQSGEEKRREEKRREEKRREEKKIVKGDAQQIKANKDKNGFSNCKKY